MDGDLYGCRPNDLLMGRHITTSTSAGGRRVVGTWLSADDMISVGLVTNQSFLSTTRQLSSMHVCPSPHNILPVMVRMKPGIYLPRTNVPSLGGNTLAPSGNERLEALVLTGWGKACVRPPAAIWPRSDRSMTRHKPDKRVHCTALHAAWQAQPNRNKCG